AGQTPWQSLRHKRDRAATLRFNVAGGNAHMLAIGADQIERLGRGSFENALKFFAGLGFDNRRGVAHRDGSRRLLDRQDQIAPWKFIADGEQIRSSLAATAVHRMALRASRALLVVEQFPPVCGVALVAHGEVAILALFSSGVGWG